MSILLKNASEEEKELGWYFDYRQIESIASQVTNMTGFPCSMEVADRLLKLVQDDEIIIDINPDKLKS